MITNEKESWKKGNLIDGDLLFYNENLDKAIIISNYGYDNYRIRLYCKIGGYWKNENTGDVSSMSDELNTKIKKE